MSSGVRRPEFTHSSGLVHGRQAEAVMRGGQRLLSALSIKFTLQLDALQGIPTGHQFHSLKVVQDFCLFVSNKSLLYIYDLLQTYDPPASGFQTLGLQVCTTLLDLLVLIQ